MEKSELTVNSSILLQMKYSLLMEIKSLGQKMGAADSGFTAGIFYCDSGGIAFGAVQKKNATGKRYYEVDISAHWPRLSGTNKTG